MRSRLGKQSTPLLSPLAPLGKGGSSRSRFGKQGKQSIALGEAVNSPIIPPSPPSEGGEKVDRAQLSENFCKIIKVPLSKGDLGGFSIALWEARETVDRAWGSSQPPYYPP
jgi:hypothetical protein